jgi:hypothetical protein
MLCCARALAVTEACPADVGEFHPIGATDVTTMYSFVLYAHSSRTVDGALIVGTTAGWFEVDFLPIELSERTHFYRGKFGLESRTSFESAPIYVSFPQRVDVVFSYVSHARTLGETQFGWDAKGGVACSPQAGVDTNEPPPFTGVDVSEVSPRVDLHAAPSRTSVFAQAKATNAPGSTDCAAPFAQANISVFVKPEYPDSEQQRKPAFSVVEVVVNAAARPVDAWMYLSSGSTVLDSKAVDAAEAAKYRAGKMFCRPTGGFLLYPVEFDP